LSNQSSVLKIKRATANLWWVGLKLTTLFFIFFWLGSLEEFRYGIQRSSLDRFRWNRTCQELEQLLDSLQSNL
jgi:hypothetical protein